MIRLDKSLFLTIANFKQVLRCKSLGAVKRIIFFHVLSRDLLDLRDQKEVR